MYKKALLLQRLEQIASSLQSTKKARALIGFCSAGIETVRMDEYSDLDFLAVAKKGYKNELSENLSWLSAAAPIGYCFIDKYDAYKIFFHDGIYCEFGICEEDGLSEIPHSEGRIIWCEDDFDKSLRLSSRECEYGISEPESVIDEILTDLYVGLCRYARGEKLAANRYIQRRALDNLLLCSRFMAEERSFFKDIFAMDRRYEMRFPKLAVSLNSMIQGYEKCPEAALAILKCVETYFRADSFIKTQITDLAAMCMHKRDLKVEV